MRIAVVGSRDFSDLKAVSDFIDHLPRDVIMVSGGARGVDRAAARRARKRDLDIEVYPAEWERYGKRAGYLRNVDIVKASDIVVAFWDGRSRGTKHTIDLAKKEGKLVIVVDSFKRIRGG